MRQGSLRPEVVVHIGRISALGGTSLASDGGIQIGALTTMRSIEKSEELKGGFDLLRQGASQVSCPQIRNVATLGGNTCNGIPSADTVPPLIALGAEAVIQGPRGEKMVPLEEFHLGPGRTVLKAEEVLKGFRIPCPPPCSGGCYLKYTPRGTFELAIIGVAVLVALNPKDGTCQAARIVLGACGPTPLRVKKAENVLLGSHMDPPVIEKAAQIAAEESSPNPGVSVRASAPYRREMVKVWTKGALENAALRAKGLRDSL
jgi:carbon-monoxide dehydrogenase medium subunit